MCNSLVVGFKSVCSPTVCCCCKSNFLGIIWRYTNAFHVQAAINSISLSSKACTGIQVYIDSLVFSGSLKKYQRIGTSKHLEFLWYFVWTVNWNACPRPHPSFMPNSRPSRMAWYFGRAPASKKPIFFPIRLTWDLNTPPKKNSVDFMVVTKWWRWFWEFA